MQGLSQPSESGRLNVTRPQGTGKFQSCLSLLAGCLVIATLVAEQRQISAHSSLVAAVADLLIDYQSLVERFLSSGEIAQNACYPPQRRQAGSLALAITGGALERQRLGVGGAGSQ